MESIFRMKTLLITYLSFLTVTLIATLWAFGWVAFRFWSVKQVEILAAGIGIFLFPIQYVFRKTYPLLNGFHSIGGVIAMKILL